MADPAPPFERKLAAIFAADVAGYSRLMGEDEVGTMRTLTAHREVMDRLIAQHRGRIANTAGDSVLAEFPSVVEAVKCAVEIQEELREKTQGVPEDRQLRFRIGVHVGDVMVRGSDLLGDGVNVAARLQALAEPGGICVSGDAHQYARKPLPLAFTDLGQQAIKNVGEGVRAYAIRLGEHRTVAQDHDDKPLPLPDKPSIAVLPFTNMSGDPEQEYFADGIVEDIITALSRVKWFFVIARNSSYTYKRRTLDLRQVGRELGVHYLLEGSVRKSGNRVRITAQLVEAETGRHLWADRYEGDLTDVFGLQDEITRKVILEIEPQILTAEAHRAAQVQPQNLAAWDLVIRALPHLWRFTLSEQMVAQTLLKRAIEADPSYARARALLGWSYLMMFGLEGQSPMGSFNELAYARGREAYDLDRHDPWALLVLGVCYARQRRPVLAEERLREALEANPNFALAHAWLGYARACNSEAEQALQSLERATRLSPRDPYLAISAPLIRAHAHFAAGNYEETAAVCRDRLELNSDHMSAWRQLTASLALLGQVDEAKAACRELLKRQPALTISVAGSAVAFTSSSVREHYLSGLRLAGVPE
jgi:adenylate cyclase